MSKLPYLNLGCGLTFHKEWTNIDFVSSSEHVIAHNLLLGIPLPDNSCEVVYHSHMLEHLPGKKAAVFIKECFRVLKPGSTIRIAVPDLEAIVNNYTKYLNESISDVSGAEEKYEWTMLELYDQTVRNKSGGEMLEYIIDESKKNDAFLLERNGYEVKRIMELFRPNVSMQTKTPSYSIVQRIKNVPDKIKDAIVRLVLGKDYEVYVAGKFRTQGEIHQWMYDRYSLKCLLEKSGFRESTVRTAFESRIPGWENFNLDGSNGTVRKPDSLFMEAVK
jgi:predicted SAM-dependent methyltransferase